MNLFFMTVFLCDFGDLCAHTGSTNCTPEYHHQCICVNLIIKKNYITQAMSMKYGVDIKKGSS